MNRSPVRRAFAPRRFALALLSLVAAVGLAASARAADVYVPSGSDSAEGDNATSSLLSSGSRALQFIIASDLLSGAGSTISGLSFRLNGGAASSLPATDLTATDLEIRLGTGPADLSEVTATYASNLSNATLVRDGAYTLTTGVLPGDGSSPNAFAALFNFTTPYNYTEGNSLVIEIRHTGFGSNITLDAVTLGDSMYNAFQTGTFAGTFGSATPFPVMALTFSAIPEPSTYAALAGLGALGLALLRRRR